MIMMFSSTRTLLVFSVWMMICSASTTTSAAFQVQKTSTTINSNKQPFSKFYYQPTRSVFPPTIITSQQQKQQQHPWSLQVTFLPEDNHNHNGNADPFFFRAPFPAENPIIPSEFTDETMPQPRGGLQEADADGSGMTKMFWEPMLESYWGARIILICLAFVYGTNFPLGAIMAHALPASAATCSRMVLASLALSPFVVQIKPHLRLSAILCGCCTALGYVSQSVALVDTDPAKVSFLGAATVLWCPFMEWLVERKPMGIRDAPQTWLAALLCMAGVGFLELWGTSGDVLSSLGRGDLLALVQAIGFGTGCFLSARMVQKEPNQVLPITSVLIATTAFWSMIWCFLDGWMSQPGAEVMTLPNLLFADGYQTVAMAVVWTGLISTSLNFVIEISALGRVPPSEASVLLASEPLWAAFLAATVFHQSEFGMNDYLGGFFILSACFVNAVLKPSDFHAFLSGSGDDREHDQDVVETTMVASISPINGTATHHLEPY